MLYKPKYCANCGEKVERLDWSIFTSRRFCIVCETEYKGADWIPRAFVGLGLLMFVLGFGGLISKKAEERPVKRAAKVVEKPVLPAPAQTEQPQQRPVNDERTQRPADPPPRNMATALPPSEPIQRIVSDPVYMCGAETKKGTPCSRRVKGSGRCFQHKGMRAMLAESKLRVE
jgi:hypothetical protein